jgi:hypothetical protein
LAVYAFLPVPLMGLAAVVPRRSGIDKFGEGHNGTKVVLLTFTTVLLAAGATFRAVVAYFQRPLDDPGWFHSKACYYGFNYAVELVVVYTYALSRFDRRFHIPDGSSAPGHYSGAEFKAFEGSVMVATADCVKVRRGGKEKQQAAVAAAAAVTGAPTAADEDVDVEATGSGATTPITLGSRKSDEVEHLSESASLGEGTSDSSRKSQESGQPSEGSSLAEGTSERNSLVRAEDMAWMAKATVSRLSLYILRSG